MCLIGHLPFLFLLFQHFLYLDSTRLQREEPRPILPALPKGRNHCHTGFLDSLVRMHDTTLIHRHTDAHMHPLLSHPYTRFRSALPPLLHPPYWLELSSSDPRRNSLHTCTRRAPFPPLISTSFPQKAKPVYLCAPGPHGYCHRWC